MYQARPYVLMVDDDSVDAYSIRKAFKRSQIETEFEHVGGGRDLFAYLAKVQAAGRGDGPRWPDVILLDINMPEKDGYEVLRELRGETATRLLPVVMLTTSDVPEHVDEAYRQGANSYIVKPSSIAEMKAFVEQFEAFWFRLARLPGHASASWRDH